MAPSASTAASCSSSSASSAVVADKPSRCGYRTGKCTNLQAVKRNGKLHKLCEYHREKANNNQKKLDRKKRALRFSPYPTSPSNSIDSAASPQASPMAAPLSPSNSCSSLTSLAVSTSTALTVVQQSQPQPHRVLTRNHSVPAINTSHVGQVKHEIDDMSPRATDEVISLAPTNLHEQPVALNHDEFAFFYELMTYDIQQQHKFQQPAMVSSMVKPGVPQPRALPYAHPFYPFMNAV